jgi:hypothetical protein
VQEHNDGRRITSRFGTPSRWIDRATSEHTVKTLLAFMATSMDRVKPNKKLKVKGVYLFKLDGQPLIREPDDAYLKLCESTQVATASFWGNTAEYVKSWFIKPDPVSLKPRTCLAQSSPADDLTLLTNRQRFARSQATTSRTAYAPSTALWPALRSRTRTRLERWMISRSGGSRWCPRTSMRSSSSGRTVSSL